MSVPEVACRFDDALPVLVGYVSEAMNLNASQDGVFLRDGFGRVAFIGKTVLSRRTIGQHQRNVGVLLGSTAFPTGAIQNPEGPFAELLTDKSFLTNWVTSKNSPVQIRLFDRRFFGRDWVLPPANPIRDIPPVLVFGSIKGGVGRTTALFVTAIQLAQSGRNVLLVDLDLEAPGLASLVFAKGERPRYGVIDYLVENGLGGVSDAGLADFVGTSSLTDTSRGLGRVDLAPAAGERTLDAPENMLAKLARALVEDPQSGSPPLSLSSQIRDLVTRLAKRSAYDAVLVDARAGFSELTAGALLGLGGTVALFGTNHPHTFEGFRYLVAHLSTLPIPDSADDWRQRIKFVHALASASAEERTIFDDQLYELLAEQFYESDEGDDVFTFSLEELEAPHKALRVFFDGTFLGADPVKDSSVINQDVYRAAFGGFIEQAFQALRIDQGEEQTNSSHG